jgi:hypothetical protein
MYYILVRIFRLFDGDGDFIPNGVPSALFLDKYRIIIFLKNYKINKVLEAHS